MRKLRRNWSLTKNDITKSLSRITKKKSRSDLSSIGNLLLFVAIRVSNWFLVQDKRLSDSGIPATRPTSLSVTSNQSKPGDDSPSSQGSPTNSVYQNMQFSGDTSTQDSPTTDKNKNITRKAGFLNKFRRSMSMSTEAAQDNSSPNPNRPQSTFYITDTINVDAAPKEKTKNSASPKTYKTLTRPQNPPPPAPQNVGKCFIVYP